MVLPPVMHERRHALSVRSQTALLYGTRSLAASARDLLAVFDTDDEQVGLTQGYAIAQSIGRAEERHLAAPREVQVLIASRTLGEWDPSFVEHVARDGIVLWARGPLPAGLGALTGVARSH